MARKYNLNIMSYKNLKSGKEKQRYEYINGRYSQKRTYKGKPNL
jgi:hypothetical protein